MPLRSTIRLRNLDEAGIREYLSELRPRFFVLRVRAKGRVFRWAVPSWAVEEVLRFGIRLAPLLPGIVRLLPERARRPLGRFAGYGTGTRTRATLGSLDELFSERHRDLLKPPPGEPLVAIEARDVAIEIQQIALGART